MNYDEFKSDFMKENLKLRIALAATLIIFSVGTSLIYLQRQYFLYQGGPIFDERPLAEEICRIGFLGIANDNPNPHVVTSDIINLVKKEPFSLIVDKLLLVQSLEKGACKIILRSEGSLLSFKVILEGKDSNPFFYRLKELEELQVTKEKL